MRNFARESLRGLGDRGIDWPPSSPIQWSKPKAKW